MGGARKGPDGQCFVIDGQCGGDLISCQAPEIPGDPYEQKVNRLREKTLTVCIYSSLQGGKPIMQATSACVGLLGYDERYSDYST